MRLIDADALDQEMYRKSFEVDDGRNVWNSGLWIRYKIYEEAVRDAPTVDAVPVEDHKILVEKARREAYHSGYKQGRFDEFIEAQYGRTDYDIVPVCRCKDCKWQGNETECPMFDPKMMKVDDFCSYAERRKEE